jgi:hypothetical protein
MGLQGIVNQNDWITPIYELHSIPTTALYGGAIMRGRIPNNESAASWEIKCKAQQPEAARLNASLRFAKTNPGYVSYIESMESKIDEGRGYKGRHEEAGRKAGTRVLSRMVWDRDLQEEVEEFYVG